MKEHSKKIVVGIDVGDQKSHVCEMNEQTGEVMKRAKLATEQVEFLKYFSVIDPATIIIEVGSQSPWMSRLLESLGHEVIVANARELRFIYGSKRKNDRLDAEKLARIGRLDRDLLCAVKHRSEQQQADLAVVRARDSLLKVRQQLVNHIRGVLKAFGIKPPKSYPAGFHKKVLLSVPKRLGPALMPLVNSLKDIQKQIKELDKRIEVLAEKHYPDTGLLTQVRGVGSLIALTFVLTLAEPSRFKTSRAVGAYLGLVPGQNQSGQHNPKQAITKQGDALLRRYLVQGANYMIGPFGSDSDLRRFALQRLEKRGKSSRKQLVIAVARKLSVLLHHLWSTGEVYEPLHHSTSKNSLRKETLAITA